jgi:hypothetical protein
VVIDNASYVFNDIIANGIQELKATNYMLTIMLVGR